MNLKYGRLIIGATNQESEKPGHGQSDTRKKSADPIEIPASPAKKIKISENPKVESAPVKIEQVFEEDEITIGPCSLF